MQHLFWKWKWNDYLIYCSLNECELVVCGLTLEQVEESWCDFVFSSLSKWQIAALSYFISFFSKVNQKKTRGKPFAAATRNFFCLLFNFYFEVYNLLNYLIYGSCCFFCVHLEWKNLKHCCMMSAICFCLSKLIDPFI
jgi:hypothetical protein